MNTRIAEQVPLAPYTTFRIGGPAEFFVSVSSVAELRDAVSWAKERALPIAVLGGGSNVLIADEGVKGLVVRMDIGGSVYEERDGTVAVRAGAGMSWDALVGETVERGLWGIENLSGIPGSVGGAVVQGIGAYNQAVGETLESVEVFDCHAGELRSMSREECAFEYRDSFFKHDDGRHVVVSATFVLSEGGAPNLAYRDLAALNLADPTPTDVRNAVLQIRHGKFPDLAEAGTAGSFFKNPILPQTEAAALAASYPGMPLFDMPETDGVKVPLGWILDRVLHLRGARVGDVCAYENQALVIVNTGSASARDVDAFVRNIEQKVFDATGIHIEREVRSLA